jgi:hypothetical protein
MFAARSVSNLQCRPSFPAHVNQIVPSLPQVLIPISLKPRRINTYAPPPRFAVFWPQSPACNSFIGNTYEKPLRKSFRSNTYKKPGEGGPSPLGVAQLIAQLSRFFFLCRRTPQSGMPAPVRRNLRRRKESRFPVLSFPPRGKEGVG